MSSRAGNRSARAASLSVMRILMTSNRMGVLASPSYRAAAGRVAAQIAALPSIDAAPTLLNAWLEVGQAA